jgi:hypothetical protein
MSTYSGPEIVDNGLVIHIDATNTTKSWRGNPTTNYIPFPEASHNGSSFVNFGYNYANLGATYTYGVGVSNPVNASGVLQYFTGTTGYKYFSIDSTSLPATGTYTFSYYARITSAGNNNVGNSQLWRANGSDRGVTGDWNPTFTSEWRRYSTTGPAEAGTILQYFPIHSGSITGGCTIEYCGFQLEAGSYATPFVIGARSNTQALVDLTSNNTITATSLTYASDNTFSFSGSGNYIDCGTGGSLTLGNNGPFTASAWIRITTLKNFSGIISKVQSDRGGVYSFMCTAHNNGTLAFYNNAAWYYSTNAGITTNTWYNVVFSFNGSVMSYYVNGNAAGTSSLTWPETTAHKVFIGSWYSVNTLYDFNGIIANAQLYNRALSEAEVKINYNAYRGRYGL